MKNNAFHYAKIAAAAALDKQGRDVVALDVRDHSSLTDVFVFVGATSHVHVRALEDAVREALNKEGAKLLRTDGQRGHLWRVLDFGGLIVHIMEEKTREFYAVERLWNSAKQVTLDVEPKSKPKSKAKPKKKAAPVKKKAAKKKK